MDGEDKTPNELKAEAMYKTIEGIGARVFFEKQLTSSDVSASGRVVVPKVRSDMARKRISSVACVHVA